MIAFFSVLCAAGIVLLLAALLCATAIAMGSRTDDLEEKLPRA